MPAHNPSNQPTYLQIQEEACSAARARGASLEEARAEAKKKAGELHPWTSDEKRYHNVASANREIAEIRRRTEENEAKQFREKIAAHFAKPVESLQPLAEAAVIPPAVFREATDNEKTLMRENIRRYLAEQSVEEEITKTTGVARIQPDYLALIKESISDLAVYYTGFCAPLEDFLRSVKRKDAHGEAVRILTALYEKIFPSSHPPFAAEH